MTSSPDNDVADQHSYFAPMVDMLAGVVFILVILLASVTLVSRDDFAASQAADTELAKIAAELDAARALDRAVLEPRRQARIALKRLMERLTAHLAEDGITAEADPASGRLTLGGKRLFATSGVALDGDGEATVASLARALSRELPCLAPGEGAPPAQACAGYPPARLARVTVAVPQDAGGPRADVRALGILSSIVKGDPALLALRAGDGEAVLGYEPGTSRTAEEGAPPSDTVSVTVQMELPPLPPA